MKQAAAVYCGTSSNDPVCEMLVDEQKAKAAGCASHYQQKTYYFCAAACKRKFDKTPNLFLAKGDQESADKGARLSAAAPTDMRLVHN
jgi:YHS domain-containing protein